MIFTEQNKKLNRTDFNNKRLAMFKEHSKEVREKFENYGDEYNFKANNIL